MDIRLKHGYYKSITSLEWKNIPMFAVITGANGSGKTQLLELIARSANAPIPVLGQRPHGRDFDQRTFEIECSKNLNTQNTVFLRSFWDTSDTVASIQQVYELADVAWRTRSDKIYDSPTPRPGDWDSLWNSLEQKTGISREELNQEQFYNELPPNFLLMRSSAINPASMHTSIPLLFISYAAKIHQLELDGMNEDEITQALGPTPWQSVNDALRRAGLQYEILAPTTPKRAWARNFDLIYQLELKHIRTGTVIPVSALSSGERVVFLTAIWSYFFNQATLKSRTAILLLDEPDAHLHPALTKVFLRVIRDELVDRHGIRVLMTTHSPSTVALTDEEHLFVMTHEEPRIRHAANKWDAAAQLTLGLVTVGTDTKTVFVEDRSDAEFYQAVQAILAQDSGRHVDFDVTRSLNFIPASEGRNGGGKNSVIKWVKAIETTQVAGIVDRDEADGPGGRIHIGKRRHLESYLLDPLFVYALLLEENVPNRPDFAPDIDHRHSRTLLEISPSKLQQIVDGMATLYSQISAREGNDLISVDYIGDVSLSIPRWIIDCDMKKLLNPLRQRLGVSWEPGYLVRKYEVLRILPKDLMEILLAIQNA